MRKPIKRLIKEAILRHLFVGRPSGAFAKNIDKAANSAIRAIRNHGHLPSGV